MTGAATTDQPRAVAGLTRHALDELSRRRQEPDWLRQVRLDAFAVQEATPLVEQATGNWRHASLAGLDLEQQQPLPDASSSLSLTPDLAGELAATLEQAGTLVLRDGAVAEARLDPALAARGVVLLELSEALRHPSLAARVQEHFGRLARPSVDKLAALHYAFFNAAAVVYVPKGVVVERPLRVAYQYSQPGLSAFAHTLLIAEESAEVALVDEYSSPAQAGPSLASSITEAAAGRGAQVRYVHVQRWGQAVWSFSHQRAHLAQDASVRTLNVALGARHARNTVQVILHGNGAQADLLGVVAGDGRQHVDFQTLQDHHGSATRSDLMIHNVLDGRSSSNFTGLIRINPSSRQTESNQQQKNVLLSSRAKADSDPKLEILNNDVVRCTHGASVGPMDAEVIFYLQSRGLTRQEAQALAIEGFFQSVLERLDHPALQAAVWAVVEARLAAARERAAA